MSFIAMNGRSGGALLGFCLALAACTPAERRRGMWWAQRLKRVFGVEIETCAGCGGKVRVIARICEFPIPYPINFE